MYPEFRCDAAKAKPEDIVFVDDRPKNIEAALGLGMQVVLFGEAVSTTHNLPWVPDFEGLRKMLLNFAQQGGAVDALMRATDL